MEAITAEEQGERRARSLQRLDQQKRYFKIGVLSSIGIIALLIAYYIYSPDSFVFLLGFIFIFNLLSIVGLVYLVKNFLRKPVRQPLGN